MSQRMFLTSDPTEGGTAAHEFWDLLGRLSGSDISATPIEAGGNLSLSMDLLALGDVVMSRTRASAIRFDTRPRAIENEHLVLQLPVGDTRLFLEREGGVIQNNPGAALVGLNSERQIAGLVHAGNNIALSVPLSSLTELVENNDVFIPRIVPTNTLAFSLLRNYVLTLYGQASSIDARAEGVVARQLAELVALALGASPTGRDRARCEALPRARLLAAKSFITKNLGRPRLTDEVIGREIGVSASVLRRLFQSEGLTVAGHVREQRLSRARVMLIDPQYDRLKVIDIAERCGFTDVSTFNRAFRRHFGMNPREMVARSLTARD